jgi:hypothetical protein
VRGIVRETFQGLRNDRLEKPDLLIIGACMRYMGSSGTVFDPPGHWGRRAALDRLDRLSRILDIAFAIPGTNFRFGVEAVLRLVPGIGDVAASTLSCWLLYEAYRLGVPPALFGRMVINVLVEGTAGTVPVVGDLFDIGWRANRRNLRILREHFEREGLL